MILGASPPPINNSTSDNVGTYSCDGNGTCTLIESYYDASAPFTPLAPDEEEIDVTPENPNSNSSAGNAHTKSGAVLNDLCFGGGSGGGGSSSAPTLPPVITTAPRPERYFSVRSFYRNPANGNGGAPNGGSRAMREMPIKSSALCLWHTNDRRDAAVAAYQAAFPLGIGLVRVMFVTTFDGKREIWLRPDSQTAFTLGSTDCTNPGN